jgi:glycerophosphoryl diester phosphodiesterase
MSAPLVIAHRGASGYHLENSRAAFTAAVELGADGVELDVHGTADHGFVVHHDPTLPGLGRIADLTAEQTEQYALPSGEPVLFLDEALGILSGILVYVEVKSIPLDADGALIQVLDRGPSPERYAVHSFDHRIIRRLGQLRATLSRGILLCSRPVDPAPLVDQAGADTVWLDRQWVDRAVVDQMRERNVGVIAWTVDDAEEIRHLQQLDVAGICGNYPDRIRSIMEQPDG